MRLSTSITSPLRGLPSGVGASFQQAESAFRAGQAFPRLLFRHFWPKGWRAGFLAGLLLMVQAISSAHGLELYTLQNQHCEGGTGLIVAVDENTVYLLDVSGRLSSMPRDSVTRILVFNTLDNPIAKIELSGKLGELAREIHLEGNSEPSYWGWPIRFQGELIIFYDVEGKTHVEEISNISLIQFAQNLPSQKRLPGHKPRVFSQGGDLAECLVDPTGEHPVIYPTRIIGDQIKIGKFLEVYQSGFHELERFRVRSFFYPRPLLYDQYTKFALQLSDFNNFHLQELPARLPLYFQWSSGIAYNTQGLIVLGSKPVEWLPQVEPVLAFRSDVKSSFFSASLLGNPMALAVGGNFIIQNRFMFEDYFSRMGAKDVLVLPHFNHVALTGFDWRAFSIAVGYYYPVFALNSAGVFREVLSTRSSPITRFLYTTKENGFRLLFAETRLGSRHPDGDDIQLITSEEMRNPSIISPASKELAQSLEKFQLSSQFLRGGWERDFGGGLEAGLDQVLLRGKYREWFPESSNRLRYRHDITSLHASQGFGAFVALKMHLNYFSRVYETRSNGERRRPDYRNVSLTVAIEFVL